jgi:hypothetical protein
MWWGNALECRDRDGVRVVCSKDTWEKHIAPNHDEVKGREAVVKATVENPIRVYRDKDFANRKLFYTRGLLPDVHKGDYLRVVVEYKKKRLSETEVGYLRSAFSCTGIREGDELLWSQF